MLILLMYMILAQNLTKYTKERSFFTKIWIFWLVLS